MIASLEALQPNATSRDVIESRETCAKNHRRLNIPETNVIQQSSDVVAIRSVLVC